MGIFEIVRKTICDGVFITVNDYHNAFIFVITTESYTYVEKDGKLYRKASAPEWYLPEMKIQPWMYIYDDNETDVFTTYLLNENDSQPITVKFEIHPGGVSNICFASGLPIKPLE